MWSFSDTAISGTKKIPKKFLELKELEIWWPPWDLKADLLALNTCKKP